MPRARKPTAEQIPPPLYDPAVHTDPGQVVYAELYCRCGSLWRQRDPVWAVRPMVADWIGRHRGPGCGEASKADCVAERESRREAAFRAQGRGDEYAPRDHPNLDVTCTQPRPWPVLPELEG